MDILDLVVPTHVAVDVLAVTPSMVRVTRDVCQVGRMTTVINVIITFCVLI